MWTNHVQGKGRRHGRLKGSAWICPEMSQAKRKPCTGSEGALVDRITDLSLMPIPSRQPSSSLDQRVTFQGCDWEARQASQSLFTATLARSDHMLKKGPFRPSPTPAPHTPIRYRTGRVLELGLTTRSCDGVARDLAGLAGPIPAAGCR